MMLLHRWAAAGVLGAVAASASLAGQAPKAPAKPPATIQQPIQQPSKIVQPDDGPPPDQAEQPDRAAPLDSSVPPEPAITPPDPVAEEAAPAPAPVETPQPMPVNVELPELAPLAANPEQRQLQLDAEHLLKLVQELKVEVDKAGSNTLSLDAVRKADEVQRLSKSLRARVRLWQTAPGK